MVTQYNKRLEEARMELAGNIRREIEHAIAEKYPRLDIMTTSSGWYTIMDGHLTMRVATGGYPPYEIKEVTPDQLPLESHSVPELLEMARKVKAE